MRNIALLFIFFSLIALTGCGVLECIDAQQPRASTPLPGSHTFELAYKNHPTIKVTITCEKYYDAMCAERGNFWSIREIGSTSPQGLMHSITIQDSEAGKVDIFRPSCELFTNSGSNEFNSMIRINGDLYFYSSQSSDGYVFEKREFELQRIDPATAKTVTLPFTIKVDGKLLAPPTPRRG